MKDYVINMKAFVVAVFLGILLASCGPDQVDNGPKQHQDMDETKGVDAQEMEKHQDHHAATHAADTTHQHQH